MSDQADDDTQSVASNHSDTVPTKKRKPNGYFKWTVEAEEILAREVNKLKVHLKKNGTGLKKDDQWKLVMSRLKESKKTDVFIEFDNETGFKSLRSKFAGMIEEIKKRFGVTDQKTNLSAREKPPNQLESLLIEMAEEMSKQDQPAKKKKDVKKAKQSLFNSLEGDTLGAQGRVSLLNQSTDCSMISTSSNSSGQQDTFGFLTGICDDIKEVMKSDEDEEEKELRKQLLRKQLKDEDDLEEKELKKELLREQINYWKRKETSSNN